MKLGWQRRALAVVTVAVAMLAGGCDWGQWGFDASHAGYDPLEPALTVTSVRTLAQRWTTPTADGLFTQALVVVGGTVYARVNVFGGAGEVMALDAATGAARWHTPPTLNVVSPPAVSGGLLYVLDIPPFVSRPPGALRVYDAQTGAPVWSTDTPATPVACRMPLEGGGTQSDLGPTVAAGLVVFPDRSGSVCAFDAVSGAFRWSAAVGDPAFMQAGIAIADGSVFALGATQQRALVAALNVDDGSTRWTQTTFPSVGTQQAVPVVVDHRLFVPGENLATFDTATGTPGWTAPDIQQVAVGQGTVIGTSFSGRITAFNETTGRQIWSITGPGPTSVFPGPPAMANGVVYFPSDQLIAPPPSTCCAHVTALRLDTGGQLFSANTASAADVVVSDGQIYVSDINSITAFAPTNPSG